MIRLLIKGRSADAVAAAVAHQIVIEDIRTVNTRYEEVRAYTNAPRDKVVAWFHESGEQGPFPPGTLLHFSEDEPR